MAEMEKQGSALAGVTLEGNDFAALLKKEFKPKTDEAKSAVEQAVQTLAQQALANVDAAQHRRRAHDRGDDRRARQAADRAGQQDHPPRGLPEAGVGVARPALPRQQHRDRRAAEDPRHERLQAGARQDAQALQGHGLGPVAAVQEAVRGRVRPVRRRALRRAGGRLSLRPHAARRRAARRAVEARRLGACARSSPAPARA